MLKALAILSPFVSSVAAHGWVAYVTANGVNHTNYNPSVDPYKNPDPPSIGWHAMDTDLGFISPSAYSTPDIICHKSATNAGLTVPVTAGSKLTLDWRPFTWPHIGTIITYLASCGTGANACSTVDKSSLEFFKIDAVGITAPSSPPKWATDQLIEQGQKWTVTIPSAIAPGNYVLRHEIIALHGAQNPDGVQNYPQCVNVQVSGSGTSKPAGVKGMALYKSTDPGIAFNPYTQVNSYPIPGPPLISGAGKRSVEFEA